MSRKKAGHVAPWQWVHEFTRGGLGSLPRRQIQKMAGQRPRPARGHAPRPRDHRVDRGPWMRRRPSAPRMPRVPARLVRRSASRRLLSPPSARRRHSRRPRPCLLLAPRPAVLRLRLEPPHRPRPVSRGASAVAASSRQRDVRRPAACLQHRRSLRPSFFFARLSQPQPPPAPSPFRFASAPPAASASTAPPAGLPPPFGAQPPAAVPSDAASLAPDASSSPLLVGPRSTNCTSAIPGRGG